MGVYITVNKMMKTLKSHVLDMAARTQNFSTGWRSILTQEDVETLVRLAREQDAFTLESSRRIAAQAAFEHFDFGEEEVCATNGWEYMTPGADWHRTIFLDRGSEDSEKAIFTVVFESDSDRITNTYFHTP